MTLDDDVEDDYEVMTKNLITTIVMVMVSDTDDFR